MSANTVTDELASIAEMLCVKYPHRSERDIASLVDGVYAKLLSKATVTAPLIPLTVNCCQKTLRQQRRTVDEGLKAANVTTTPPDAWRPAAEPLIVSGHRKLPSANYSSDAPERSSLETNTAACVRRSMPSLASNLET